MIVALNFANAEYKKHQKLNTKTAFLFGKVDKVYSFSPEDIDKDFYEQNKNILSQKRGAGLWLWKPYFILKVLNEINERDVLIYMDSGAFYVRNVYSLITKLKASKQDIMLFEQPLIECQWTRKSVFETLNMNNEKTRFSNQTLGTIIIIKTPNSCDFIKKWLELCQKEELIFPKEKDDKEDFMYIAHREDQSILSVLGKKEGIIPFSDPTDYGRFFNQYLAYDRLFCVNKKEEKHIIEKPCFLLPRKANPIKYYITYLLKSFLNELFGLRKINV